MGKIDKDISGLKLCCKGLDITSEQMRKATIEYLLDRYVTHPPKIMAASAEKPGEAQTQQIKG